MNDGNDCDVADFIPVGCHKCGEEAGEYCQSGSGKISSYSYMQFLSSNIGSIQQMSKLNLHIFKWTGAGENGQSGQNVL